MSRSSSDTAPVAVKSVTPVRDLSRRPTMHRALEAKLQFALEIDATGKALN
jgi:hypothetical protein